MSGEGHRCLVTGGARSGKSSWAEQRLGGGPARYLATGYPDGDDPEWSRRVARHRGTRPSSWETLEGLAIEPALCAHDPRPLLVDCLTLWLTRTMDAVGAWAMPPGDAGDRVRERFAPLAAALRRSRGEVVLVTNEVGCGIVPATTAGRLFADLLGELNREVASVCDEVVLMVAGIPVPVKGGPPSWRNR